MTEPFTPSGMAYAAKWPEGTLGRSAANELVSSIERQAMALAEKRLQQIAALQSNALAYIRSHGFVMDVVGPLPDDADELTRWKVLAFSLYSDLCEAQSIAAA